MVETILVLNEAKSKMAFVFKHVIQILSTIENRILNSLSFPFTPENLAPAFTNLPTLKQNSRQSNIFKDLLNDSILWAVPKKRRTIERRLQRKFGCEKYVLKIFQSKRNILTCLKCGSYHEAGRLCPTCYSKVKEVTEEMQEAIENHLGIAPVENEVVVLYEGEKQTDPEFYQGKRIIEMKKERPKIFSDNLLQRSTQTGSNIKEVTKVEEVS